MRVEVEREIFLSGDSLLGFETLMVFIMDLFYF